MVQPAPSTRQAMAAPPNRLVEADLFEDLRTRPDTNATLLLLIHSRPGEVHFVLLMPRQTGFTALHLAEVRSVIRRLFVKCQLSSGGCKAAEMHSKCGF